MSKNWHQRIDEALARGRFTVHDKNRAAKWVTCACGVQDKRLHQENGIPFDGLLFSLGVEFCKAVEYEWFGSAREKLEQIEARAAFLISQLAPAAPPNAVSTELPLQPEGEI